MRRLAVLLGFALVTGVAAQDAPPVDAHGDALPPGALLRLGTIRWRAEGTVAFPAFLPQQRALLTVSQQYVAQVWDLASGKPIRQFDIGGRDTLNAVVLTPYQRRASVSADGRTLACLDRENRLGVWDVTTGKSVARLSDGQPPAFVALAPDGKSAVTFTYNQGYTLWDVAKGAAVRHFGKETASGQFHPTAIELNATGQSLLGWGYANENGASQSAVQIWDVTNGKSLLRKSDFPQVPGVSYHHLTAFSPDHRLMAIPDADCIHLVEVETAKTRHRLEIKHDPLRAKMLFSPDNRSLLHMSGHGEAVTVWDVKSGKVLHQHGKATLADANVQSRSPFVAALALSADATELAWGYGPAIFRMDVRTGKIHSGADGSATGLTRAFFVPDGRTVVTRGTDTSLRRWDATAGRDLGAIAVPSDSFTLGLVSHNLKWFFGGVLRQPFRVIDVASGKEHMTIPWPDEASGYTVTVSPDSRILVLATRPGDSDLRLYDLEAGKPLRTLAFAPPPPDPNTPRPFSSRRLFFTSDSALLAAGDTCITVWNVADGREIRQIHLPPTALLRHIALSPDHRRLAVQMYGGELTIWELATGTRFEPLVSAARGVGAPSIAQLAYRRAASEMNTFAMSLAFSPDSRLLAAADDERHIDIWDVLHGTRLGTLEGHRGGVCAVSFSPDGKRLLSCSTDTTALIWDMQPFRAKLKEIRGEVNAEALAGLWAGLGRKDIDNAQRVVLKLAGDPAKALPFLRERLSAARGLDPKLLVRWIADLDSPLFKVRDQAGKELAKAGELALPALRDALKHKSPEVRQRAEQLISKLHSRGDSEDRLQLLRAVEVLELIATPEARSLLQSLADGAPGALATVQAQAVLRRWPAPSASPR